jgi:hypothetical protein
VGWLLVGLLVLPPKTAAGLLLSGAVWPPPRKVVDEDRKRTDECVTFSDLGNLHWHGVLREKPKHGQSSPQLPSRRTHIVVISCVMLLYRNVMSTSKEPSRSVSNHACAVCLP